MSGVAKDPIEAFFDWYDSTDYNPPKGMVVPALEALVNSGKDPLVIVQALVKTIPKLGRTSKSKRELSLTLAEVVRAKPEVFSLLWNETSLRSSQIVRT